MIGTRQGPFHFACPFCGARPTKSCVNPSGKRKGKTCKTHDQRVARYRRATGNEKEAVIWTNAVETNRRRH